MKRSSEASFSSSKVRRKGINQRNVELEQEGEGGGEKEQRQRWAKQDGTVRGKERTSNWTRLK